MNANPIRNRIIRCCTLLGLLATSASCDLFVVAENTPKPEIPSSWIEFRAGDVFTFMGPADLVDQQVQGIDSFVGFYLNETMSVSFDYGWFSAPAQCGSADQECETEEIELDGKQATLLRGRFMDHSGEEIFVALVYVPEVRIDPDFEDLNIAVVSDIGGILEHRP